MFTLTPRCYFCGLNQMNDGSHSVHGWQACPVVILTLVAGQGTGTH